MTTNQSRSGTATSAWPVPTLECTYPGRIDQGHHVRAALRSFLIGCPVADDVITLTWELAANACLYSHSNRPGGQFAVTVHDFTADYVYAEVRDQGSPWDPDLSRPADCPHGLYLLQQLAATYGAAGGRRGWIVWFTVNYPTRSAPRSKAGPHPPGRVAPTAAPLHQPRIPAPRPSCPRPALTDREDQTVPEIPPARRRLVGAALRRYRENLGYRLDDAARILECDRSKISRIESGQRGIRPRDLRDLLTEYGVAEQEQQALTAIAHPNRATSWWHPYADILPTPWLDYLIIEAAASQIQIYQPQQVPDLLQTEDYARGVIAADPTLPPDTHDLILKALLTRQHLVLEERRPELAVVIGEAALHQVVSSSEVMNAQLTHLAELAATHPQLTIQVLPFSGGAHPATTSGPFSILRLADSPNLGVVHLSGPCGGVILDSPSDITSHTRAFTLLCVSALAPASSTRLLRDGAARYQAHGSASRFSR